MEQVISVVIIVAFALVNGINDGGTVVAAGSRVAVSQPWIPVAALVLALGLGPLLITRVAQTLASRLVGFGGAGGQIALIAAVLGTLLVVWFLTTKGLPTSLTVGLIGAIAGAGVAAGLPVAWGMVGTVLMIAAVAPLVGGLASFALQRASERTLGPFPGVRRAVPRFGYLLQCVAYGANDGQKVLAVLAVVGVGAGVNQVPWALWFGTVAVFGVGTVIGFARLAPTLAGGVLPLRNEQAGAAQVASAASVLGSSLLGSPVSLTQTVTGGLIGAGVAVTPRRIRWQVVSRIAAAWALTLPAAFVAGAMIMLSVEVFR